MGFHRVFSPFSRTRADGPLAYGQWGSEAFLVVLCIPIKAPSAQRGIVTGDSTPGKYYFLFQDQRASKDGALQGEHLSQGAYIDILYVLGRRLVERNRKLNHNQSMDACQKQESIQERLGYIKDYITWTAASEQRSRSQRYLLLD
jgi:hypothetical protein